MTRGDVTAASNYQAQLAVPGRVIPNDPEIEAAIRTGAETFRAIGCSDCHVPSLPLTDHGWIYTEPNPYNPPGNLQPGDAQPIAINLTRWWLDRPRLGVSHQGVVWVPAFTDLKLHDITAGPNDPNREPLDQTHPAGSPEFFAGNPMFLTRKLWGVANEPPYFHHGQYTTLRQAVEAHHGEAESQHQQWSALSSSERDSIIEFLKSLQVLRRGSRFRVVDEHGRRKFWPPHH
jgi:CxxC motif-containing protein (DUF1111 family)